MIFLSGDAVSSNEFVRCCGVEDPPMTPPPQYGIAIEHMKQKEQCHSFSACVDAGYDIKESITDIPRDIQQTMQ